VAKYVARIERAGLAAEQLLALSDAEVLSRIAPAPRPNRYGGRIAPDFAHVHAELKRPSLTLIRGAREHRLPHRHRGPLLQRPALAGAPEG
jgi:hypothetical protein